MFITIIQISSIVLISTAWSLWTFYRPTEQISQNILTTVWGGGGGGGGGFRVLAIVVDHRKEKKRDFLPPLFTITTHLYIFTR